MLTFSTIDIAPDSIPSLDPIPAPLNPVAVIVPSKILTLPTLDIRPELCPLPDPIPELFDPMAAIFPPEIVNVSRVAPVLHPIAAALPAGAVILYVPFVKTRESAEPNLSGPMPLARRNPAGWLENVTFAPSSQAIEGAVLPIPETSLLPRRTTETWLDESVIGEE
jgi:hypothetical protein